MDQPYSQQFAVRLHDIDAWGQLRTNVLLQYLEQTATEMSGALGFPAAWYEQAGTAWVLRSLTLQRCGPARHGDTVVATSWVSDQQRVRMWTEYEIRQADGAPVAVGRAEWVYVDRQRQMPRALDPALMTGWPVRDASPLWQPLPQDPVPDPPCDPATMIRRVAWYEATEIRHTNNTVYAQWFEEAARLALRAWGYPLDLAPPAILPPALRLQSLAIRFQRSTYPDDEVTVTTRLTHSTTDQQRVTLKQEIQGAAGDSLVQADAIYLL
jgi:YbgC/YbaW family acyl-CoA thioester hydrolase